METFLGTSIPVFIGMSVILAGGAAWMMGQALAQNWRPVWQLFLYALLLACADRFLIFALFEGKLLTLSGYLCDVAVLIAIAWTAFRITEARKMVTQYPWLYESAGPFGWRRREGGR